ncbi:MAG: general secretion pathway protein GspC [Polyangiaceae bacterium]|nr:general secretion pathway protein GspC [Polyangiaceae bacterium]
MAFDQILKRHFWAVLLALTGIAAFFGAQGLTQVVGATMGVDQDALAAPPLIARLPPAPVAMSDHALSADPILARNPFDSVTGPLNAPPPTLVAAQQGGELAPPPMADPWNAPDCDGVQVLIITASSDPDWSFAALEQTSEKGKMLLRRRGGQVGARTVEFVGWDRVWLVGGGQRCQTQMFKPPPAPTGSVVVAPPPPPPERGGAEGVDPSIKNGIRKVGATEFDVDRGVVDKILENQAELMRTARIVPEQENGKVVGIRLFGVKPDSLLGTLGMENGDRLEKINGFDMTSPEKALEAYARLRTADHLTVSVNRHGQATNLDYNIK